MPYRGHVSNVTMNDQPICQTRADVNSVLAPGLVEVQYGGKGYGHPTRHTGSFHVGW